WEDTDEIEISHPEKMNLFEQPEESPLILNISKKDLEGLAIISIIPNNEESKDIKRNDDESTTPPKKVTFEEQITVKISDLEKPDTILTNEQKIKDLERKNEEGYLINQELENDNKNLRQRTQELNNTIAQQNMQLEAL